MNFLNNEKQKKRRKLLIMRSIIVFSIVIICWTSFFIFGTYYRKKNVATAHTAHKKSMLAKSKNHDKKKDKQAKQTSTIVPGDFQPWLIKRTDNKKVAYLTFDDGPSNNTKKILSILDANQIKATFFLIGQNAERYPDLVKDEANDGHSIGNHTYSHMISYRETPQQFLDDINHCDSVLKSILGDRYTPKLIRFPGGSFGNRLKPFKDAVTSAGFRFVDWNDMNGDAEHPYVSTQQLIQNIKRYTGNQQTVVILMHDAPAKTTTVEALPTIIDYLKSLGYSFDKIT
nr:polysaccharide deacetylase family protein [Clostridium acetobutylicum]